MKIKFTRAVEVKLLPVGPQKVFYSPITAHRKIQWKHSPIRHLGMGPLEGLSPFLFLLHLNIIDPHIKNEAKVVCYVDDTALWHIHSDIHVSQRILNSYMEGIETWTRDLKLTINSDETNFCIFFTDRKDRNVFHPIINLSGSVIKQITHQKYIRLTPDAKLRFSQHISDLK
ncbi:hypothetical protein TNCV_4282701 [Trichonephila clavipes]|nr:hypothetical protein TNCV_4282701 [Trichonephila clavipes]